MRIYHSAEHKKRDSQFEIHEGQIVAPFESPARMEMILAELQRRNYADVVEPAEFDMGRAEKLHRADYLEFLARAYDDWKAEEKGGEATTYLWPAATMRSDKIPNPIEARLGYYSLSTDTTITEGTWAATLASKNCAEAAAQHITNGALSAFALARPPGHHAASYQFGGYCFLNNAGIAAQHLLDEGAKRVSILDIDFHHGNGTQEIFYERNDVQFLSIHGDPQDCFPYFLGYADEKGKGAGAGFNFNYPLPKGTEYAAWKVALEAAFAEIKAYHPDALVVSLGVDAYVNDPISDFALQSPDFLDIGQSLATLNLPTVFIMEGGYAIDDLGVNVVNVLDGFQNQR